MLPRTMAESDSDVDWIGFGGRRHAHHPVGSTGDEGSGDAGMHSDSESEVDWSMGMGARGVSKPEEDSDDDCHLVPATATAAAASSAGPCERPHQVLLQGDVVAEASTTGRDKPQPRLPPLNYKFPHPSKRTAAEHHLMAARMREVKAAKRLDNQKKLHATLCKLLSLQLLHMACPNAKMLSRSKVFASRSCRICADVLAGDTHSNPCAGWHSTT